MPAILSAALRLLSVVLALGIAALSLMANPTDATGGVDPGAILSRLLFGTEAYGDKLSHGFVYGVLGLVGVLAWARSRTGLLVTLLVLLAYGGGIEILQALGGVRSGDPLDLAANAAGLICGGLGAWALLRFAAPRRAEVLP
ncbi:VanZ family protein [Parvularcula oceani]|uniref:VanZ family protein n=1 Tax=Parvularcula oceani TaxID=1247963 RepID=UPI0006905F1B|nr:VanZ family protein [Parvularcula oceani]